MNNNPIYSRCSDYSIPNLTLSETEAKPLGKCGRIGVSCGTRETGHHRRAHWNSFFVQGTYAPNTKKLQTSLAELIEKLANLCYTLL